MTKKPLPGDIVRRAGRTRTVDPIMLVIARYVDKNDKEKIIFFERHQTWSCSADFFADAYWYKIVATTLDKR